MTDHSLPVRQYEHALNQLCHPSNLDQGHQLQQPAYNQTQPVTSAFDTGLVAGLRRELAARQQRLDAYDQMLVRYCETIDAQRALIEELEHRDRLRRRSLQALADRHATCADLHRYSEQQAKRIAELERERDAWQARPRDEGTRPAFPATALNRQWRPVV